MGALFLYIAAQITSPYDRIPTMKTWMKKYIALILALVVISGVCFLFSGRKEGMFIDEIYTFGLSNSYYAPYITDVKGGDLIDKVVTRQELFDYLSVGDNDRFAAGSVYYNQTRDVHPPLYYWLLNFVSSLVPGHFSMWIGLALNYVLYMLTLVLLYKLAMLLFGSRLNAVCTVLLYGLSVIGLSTMLMIRMYVLITLLSVLLAYLIARLMREKKPVLYVLVGVTVFAGLMTQYYFVFYAFFVCLAYDIRALVKKDWRGFAAFSAAALIGALCLLPAFPACLDQLFADALVSGGNAVDNLMSFGQYKARLGIFIADTRHRTKAVIYIALAAVVCALICFKRIRAAAKAQSIRLDALVLILPAVLSFVLIAVISPVSEIRYIYNLIPMLVLAVSLLLHVIEASLPDGALNRRAAVIAGVLVGALCLWDARCLPPDYLYDEYSDYDAMLEQHSAAPCVYVDDNYFSPITFDMMQLMIFDDFLVTNDTASAAMLSYIGDAPETVVFIDISGEWASGYDAGEVVAGLEASTGYTEATELYSNGFSAVYVLKGGNA